MRPAHDPFLHDAATILATAGSVRSETDYTLLIQQDGSLHMVAESDWPLDSLAAHHGARRAYRIGHKGTQVFVEGRSGLRKCTLASEAPAAIARLMLSSPGLYRLN
ncbi:MAG TPA: hypothetical protein VFB63_06095 [Bryobacteraceae bacterium]|nr:hypothetical protein [Bryobacteraceae bacterium]